MFIIICYNVFCIGVKNRELKKHLRKGIPHYDKNRASGEELWLKLRRR